MTKDLTGRRADDAVRSVGPWTIGGGLAVTILGVALHYVYPLSGGSPVVDIPFAPRAWNLLGPHIEFLLLGWMLQMAMGVAFWILPRLGSGSPRGKEILIYSAFVLLNLGIWIGALRLYLEPSWLTVTGRILEASSVLLFVLGSWRRIKPLEI